jgi:EAL domain-containing protein (putative c-di-GMP-specific phosphodiesterase class I)
MFTGSDEAVQMSMRALRRLGITFAVDDYGRGMSSINIIRKMPIDVIKLDKDFFDHVNISEQERAMLTHMVRMAKSLDMKVLFEGVETEEQHDVLLSTGCDMGQGYLYGKPRPVNVFQRLLARQKQ